MAMPRQLSVRNQRGKGFRVKHCIQIFVLVAISVWLIYQIKHSQDKKRAFKEKDSQTSNLLSEPHSENFDLGRKGLPHVIDQRNPVKESMAGHEEDERNEKEEGEEEQDSKHLGIEEEEGRIGEDAIDEQDQERSDEDTEHGDEFGDEEKEDSAEATGLLDEQDGDKDSQEAREENYRGDDVASAVHRGTHVNDLLPVIAEDGGSEKQANDQPEIKEVGDQNPTNGTTIGSDHEEVLKDNVLGNDLEELKVTVSLASEGKTMPDETQVGLKDHLESQTQIEPNFTDESEAQNNSTVVEPQNPGGGAALIELVTNEEPHNNQSVNVSSSAGGEEAPSDNLMEDESNHTSAHDHSEEGGSRSDGLSDNNQTEVVHSGGNETSE